MPETADDAAAVDEPTEPESATEPDTEMEAELLPKQESEPGDDEQPPPSDPGSDDPNMDDTSQSKTQGLQPPPRAAAALFETLNKALPTAGEDVKDTPDSIHRLTNYIDSK